MLEFSDSSSNNHTPTTNTSDNKSINYKSHAQLSQTASNVRLINQNLVNATININIKTILIITKPYDRSLVKLTHTLLTWLLGTYDYLKIYVEKTFKNKLKIPSSDAQSRLRYWSIEDFEGSIDPQNNIIRSPWRTSFSLGNSNSSSSSSVNDKCDDSENAGMSPQLPQSTQQQLQLKRGKSNRKSSFTMLNKIRTSSFNNKGNGVDAGICQNKSIDGTLHDQQDDKTFFKKKNNVKNEDSYSDLFDLVITLGGDGTVLFASRLFQKMCPPVLAFSLGSLGFLTNFNFKDHQKIISKILKLQYVKTNLRLRLNCEIVDMAAQKRVIKKTILNEITVDRGPNPFLSTLSLYGNDSFITVAQADGICIATPTGSTAYSLAAGGSLVHPSVSAISVTPICPHTLSFRPIILPDSMELKVVIPNGSRHTSWVSFDGKYPFELTERHYASISASRYYFPTVMNSDTEYFDSVSNNLNWNTRKMQKPMRFNYKNEHPVYSEDEENDDDEEDEVDDDTQDVLHDDEEAIIDS